MADEGEGPVVLKLGRPKAEAQLQAQQAPTADTELLSWIQSKLQLLFPVEGSQLRNGLEDAKEWISSLWEPEHTIVASIFLMSPKTGRMFATIESRQKPNLVLSLDIPKACDQLMYFVRDPNKLVTAANISEAVHFSSLQGSDALQSLLRAMHGLFVPVVVGNNSWPEAVKADFTAQLHKFMANLTETVFEVKGKTILYIPDERISDPRAASKQKDLVQRLESTILHWTRQIKEVVNQQDAQETGEASGPLAEIAFWRERSVDLGGIRTQLDNPAVASIVAVLEHAKSSYLAPFFDLRNLINREAIAAEDNLKFLTVLEAPCHTLAQAHPSEIPGLLAPILNCVRLVWSLSRFFNTPERITVLLRKLSNEIIQRCCTTISLPDVFGGDVEGVMLCLKQGIEAGEKWREVYQATARAVKQRSPKPWDFDTSPVFAHIDAFLQRCNDLLEVCEAQLQFAPRNPLPVFGGTKGPEVRKSILDIQDGFQKLLAPLKKLDYDVLDVKATRWHDDFNAFKGGVKDLEVMLANVIQMACDAAAALSIRMELLEGFHLMSKRPFVKRFVEKKTCEMWAAFSAEINLVKKQFDAVRRAPPKSPLLPKYAGTARAAVYLLRRLEATHKTATQVRAMLPQVPEAAEVFALYDLAHASIEQYMHNVHNEWFQTIEPGIAKELQSSLLTVDKASGGLLTMNFHKDLLAMSQEVHYWERLRLPVPYIAMEINAQREKYRVLRDNILMVVRDYNKILTTLDREERRLFADRIRHLDRRIMPGVSKLNWVADKHALEFYYREARKYCRDADVYVTDFKAANQRIDTVCRSIAELVLVSVEKKKIYAHTDFQERQAGHLSLVRNKLVAAADEIKQIMSSVHKIFEADSEEVQREWVKYSQKVDKKLEDALRHTVKKSLQELSRLLNGDAKTEVLPLFHMTMVLERSNKVELAPTLQSLFDMIHKVSRSLITVVQAVPRVALQYTETQRKDWEDAGMALPKPLPSLYELVSSDEEAVLKTIMNITSGITSIVDKVQNFLNYWEKKYKHIWEVDKEAYIRRYEKAQKSLAAFETDIKRYADLKTDVGTEESTTPMRFLRMDCAPLKQTLEGHCDAWVGKFTGLLQQLASQELNALHAHFKQSAESLALVPTSMDQLADLVNLHKKLLDERKRTEARFEPLREKYKLLERHEVSVSEEQVAGLEALEGAWAAHLTALEEGSHKLEKHKDNFREKVKHMLDSFLKDVTESSEEFSREAPYSNEKSSTASAMAFIEGGKQQVADLRRRGAELKAGMDIFGIPQPPYKELSSMEKELDMLDKIWGYVLEWQNNYGTWKDGAFTDIKVEEMEEVAVRISKSVAKLGRELKAWPVWGWIKDIIEAFKRTMPLITDLRNPAMRTRHWAQLMEHVGSTFDPESPDFTLDSLVQLRLDTHTEFIAELSVNATKELAIENNIKAISVTWQGLSLDMVEYKATYKLRSTDEVFAALEENSVTLSTMKASKYFVVFEKEIRYWEKTLSHISETVEIILQVQRNWMYLENIFIGSEDIRKQLPQESIMFENVHNTFMKLMRNLAGIGNVLRACTASGLLQTFQDMDAKLERIQKSLDNYLENKRQQFPRFYFLSSDDLLEILGQAKDPLNVQPHLKKCFEGIKKLDMAPPGENERKQYLSAGIFSPDGEYLPFPAPVVTEGRPEEWLNRVEDAMFATTKKHLYKVLEDAKATKKEKWVKDNQGQMIITAGQIVWTHECEKALADAENARRAVKALKKKWVSYLNKLTAVTRSKLSKIERNKVVALITIEVHARDVIDKLSKANCSSTNDFEWVSQLRFYWDKDLNDCVVKQVLSVFVYGYEYQGNNGRLVITPLTDRCYMTLGAAMFTRRGGNPLGPAGTGKTETVKDFGKALARYVIVFNCSDGVDFKMTGKMFSGLAQTGAWACLDEFNRIEVEVLSVVATQIATVMQAIKEGKKRFIFQGQEIRLIPSCGIFVTMNPGYAGRSELPDNLKAILRPVSMMVPDFTLIAEIMMFSEGFSSAKSLAKKMIAIMELSQQQLSKQDHYDYGLRSFVIPIARAAGSLKRTDPDASEEVILYRTMLDLIKPKLVFLDLPLFMALLSDLFPGVEIPAADGGSLRAAIEQELRSSNLQVVPEFVTKIIQVFDCKVARHGNMIVGRTGAGKSEAWKALQRALGRLRKEEPQDERYQKVSVFTINPLALSNEELYGSFDEATHEWKDGVLARIMRTVCKDEGLDQKWILFDGPVDTLWIESMNTTLDDNKLLTLLSGERIAMPGQVSLLFEVEDLSQASPATVSRAGMIYLNVEDLGWRPFITSWLAVKNVSEPVLADLLNKHIDKYMDAALEHKRLHCRELVPTDRLSCVRAFARMFDALATPDNGVAPEEGEAYPLLVEMWFLFCIIWGLGGPLDEDGRKKFDAFMREMDTRYPSSESVFEYFVDPKTRSWLPWEGKLSSAYKPAPDLPFFKILVPTVDTVRNKFIASALVRVTQHTLVVGAVGVGKTMIINSMLEALPADRAAMTINFSAQTSSNSLQDTIEGKLEKRTKGVFAPAGGKRLVCFIDDLNMPQKSKFGFIPPLELLKLWVDNGFWYDRHRCEVKHVKDMQLLAAMAPPGGGRNAFSQRISACFATINVTPPNDAQLKRIFGTILNAKLSDFDDEVKPLADAITQATIGIYRAVSRELLPTPSKSHYLFNTRDLAKIIQGMMQATRAYYNSKDEMLQLWCHETCRIIADRMWDPVDRDWLRKQQDDKLQALFSSSFNQLFESFSETIPPFVTFLRPGVEPPAYEPVRDMGALKEVLTEKLEDYGLEPGAAAMDLVLFKDALNHVCKIHRILQQPRGNALLVGVGGSGRKSLSRLAAYVAELKCFTIEITKNYRITEFREDLKGLYRQAGCANKPTVFLFDETQIVYETFLEDVNNILTSGEVPNLFPKDELGTVLDEVRAAAKAAGAGETADALYAFWLERVRTNLHVILCLSPVGETFRERCRMFPGLVNCTTINWFTEWPADALYEVAIRQLANVDLGSAAVKESVCKVFVTAHQSVEAMSSKMYAQLRRRTYVTPTNYLETVRGYVGLLGEKRKEVGDKAAKLRGGLTKLDETAVQVASMSKVAEQKAVVVAQSKTECEELLVEIVQDKRVADEQEKQVNAEAQKIAREAEEANVIAAQVQVELDKALPALQAAEEALNVLTKKDMAELKAYAKPPSLVELTLSGVMTVLRRPPTWDEAKKQLGDPSFMTKLLEYDKDKLDDALLKKIAKFTANADFTPDGVGKVSMAARGMCLWVRAMETYGHVAKEVAPKRAKLKAAQETLAKKQAALKAAQEALAAVLAKVQALKERYDESTSRKRALEEELADLEGKLARAEKLVTGLAGERTRWEASIAEYEAALACLPGDVVLACSFMSYAGPFPSEYRDELVKNTWLPQVKHLCIPASEAFDFANFLADPKLVRDWNIQGLPSDSFSTENGVMVTRGRRWPLMIDPQGQANKWVKSMEGAAGLKVLNLQMPDMARQVENAIQFGNPVLLQDVLEELDPVLEPVLAKSFIKRGNQILIKLGDKEVDYNQDFKLYVTTKLANPHYTPEISAKVMVVNFAVKEQGLEAQLLAAVVKAERPDLDKQKNDLVVKVAAGKRTQADLEDSILALLSAAEGSLLDNVALINTLDASKTTWEEVNTSLKVAEETSRKIEAASQQYRPCSVRASVLYFVLNDLSAIDPMYQFSLDAYKDLFAISIKNSPRAEVLSDRIKALNDYHTYAVFKYTARGLFERHKLLLSLQMCIRILMTANQVNTEEWQYFLKGGTVLDRSQQAPNPAPNWISEQMWDNITELDHLQNFRGIASSFESSAGEWERWYRQHDPEVAELPSEWESKCNDLQRLLLVRCLRPDRVVFCATNYVSSALGRRFVEPPVLDLAETLADSTSQSPLIFVLSAGVDPTDQLRKLAAERGMSDRLHSVALGQGQAPVAARMIEEGVREGNWVFLANCHLMTSWLPALDKLVEGLEARQPHPNFRLWLSSSPSPAFPIATLQRGIKMTTEPPKGLRANLLRLYNSVSDTSYTQCRAAVKYQKLLFALTYFHSVLLERRKFRTLGLNIPYDFNDTDFSVSDDLLKSYLDSYEATPWDALKYLIAEANYGGRVTDELDRRVLASYMNKFYCEEALAVANYPLSPLPTYYIPENGPVQSYKDYINTLPANDRPEAFGQHPNAEISYLIEDSRVLLDSLLALQPRTGGAGGAGGASGGVNAREELVMTIATDLLEQVPGPWNLEEVMKSKADDPSALHVVLFQEVERYNTLLHVVRRSCAELQKGIKGLVVMSADLDDIFDALQSAKVPALWLKTYPSLKPLGSWTRDLLQRVDQLNRWISDTYPRVFWLSGFTYPTGFLTAVLQTSARRGGVPIDSLSFEFSIINLDEKEILAPPKDGVYVRGLFLEGAGWDYESGCLTEPEPMELIVHMPIILFRPVENKKKSQKGVYSCPLYLYPMRTGTRERPSFMLNVDLRSGVADPDYWIMRGTALLLSLAS